MSQYSQLLTSNMGITLILLLVTMVNQTFARTACPSEENILPCKCTRPYGYYTKVLCEGPLKDVKDGLNIMSKYRMEVDWLNITSKEMTVLPRRVFGKADLRILSLDTPNLRVIDSEAFRTNERTLSQLYISSSSLTSLNDVLPSLKDIFNLFHLSIRNTKRLTSVPDNSFKGALEGNYMDLLDLSYNSITTIGEQAFDALGGLKYLILAGNKIKQFASSAILYPGNKIEVLDLRDNEIENLPVALIQRLDSGSEIKLQNNKITSIPLADIRTAAQKFVHIHLEGNTITCDKSFYVLALMNLKWGHLLYGVCASPAALKGKSFDDLTKEDFKNSQLRFWAEMFTSL